MKKLMYWSIVFVLLVLLAIAIIGWSKEGVKNDYDKKTFETEMTDKVKENKALEAEKESMVIELEDVKNDLVDSQNQANDYKFRLDQVNKPANEVEYAGSEDE